MMPMQPLRVRTSKPAAFVGPHAGPWLRRVASALGLRLVLVGVVAMPVAAWAGGFGIGTPGLRIDGNCTAWIDFERPDCPGEFSRTLLLPNPTDVLRDSGSGSNGVRGNVNASAGQAAATGMGALGARAGASGNSNSGLSASPHITAIAAADSTARWVDRLTASPPGVPPGTRATLMLHLPLTGGLEIGPTGIPLPAGVADESFNADLGVRVRSWDTARPRETDTRNVVGSVRFSFNGSQGLQRVFSGTLFSGLTALPNAVIVGVPITIGTPFWLDVQLQAAAGATVARPSLPTDDPRYGFPRTGSASSEFLSTLAWSVPTLVLEGGATVAVPVLTSLSGTNYNVPILSVGDPPIFANGFEP